MSEEDIFIFTSDYGNDPLIGHSYHTREYSPLSVVSNNLEFYPQIYKSNLYDIGDSITKLLTGKSTSNGNLIFA